MLRRVVEDDGMTRRQERLLEQRLLLSTRQQRYEAANDVMPVANAMKLFGEDALIVELRRRKDVEIVQDSTYWSTSYGQYESEDQEAVNEQRQMYDGVCHGVRRAFSSRLCRGKPRRWRRRVI
ncbi:hypothetical protein F442_22029 [Phytophthora nicotianae P10297]|uniref:Uncharacterized protein n=1 Tax=Phytophthora nicotianae P10297 TaxID=1317064 RepID=W2Y3B1_PHYNI|nr:hypothetical protein F442_22029 [Phytophthora nicotianae P10297]